MKFPSDLALGLALPVLVCGCARRPDDARNQPDPASPSGPEAISAQDREVLDLVLEDLLGYERFSTYPSWGARPKLIVGDETAGASWYVSPEQISAELKDAPPLPEGLLDDLRTRNQQAASLRSFSPLSPRVVVGRWVEKSRGAQLPGPEEVQRGVPFEKRYPDAKGYVRFWLPAYSRDGSTAIVRFAFGPTAHGACGTYLLSREARGWKRTYRDLAYYA